MKTLDKYRLIAGDCDAALNGRPVEDLCEADLSSIKANWCAQGNGPSTVICKLDLLKQLVRLLGPNERLKACFEAGRPVGGKLKTKRLPFTREQVSTWINAANADTGLSEDDKMLVHLLLLTAARLEELCQLTASDITTDQDHWQLRIASGQDTGTGAGIKNPASARRLMIPMGVLPRLDTWLTKRVAAGGSIFPYLTADKYGCLGTAVSKRLNRRLRKIVGPDRRLVLLSSRPTGNRVMRRAGVDPRVRYRQLGHADHGIHDKHYDAAEYFDDEDLLPAAAIMAEWLADCIGTEALPRGDGQTPGNDTGLTEPDMHVRDKSDEPASAAQHATVEPHHLPIQLQLSQPGVTSAESFEPLPATLIAVSGFGTDPGGQDEIPGGLEQNELDWVVGPSGCPFPCIQMHIGPRRNTGELEQPRDDQLSGALDRTASSRISPDWSMRHLSGNLVQEATMQRLTVAGAVDVTPNLEASGVPATRQIEPEILRENRGRLIEAKEVEDGSQAPCLSQEFAGLRVPLPESFYGLDSGIEENCQIIHQRHLFEIARHTGGRPAQGSGSPVSMFWFREALPKFGRQDG
ncbi:tyrosine-type recombinase/integrase [Propionivibrio sp.]|uniref:tyrosine-type recombinase/integrase n=1 Tax=Propionivibrio sp. TaxID=2212460 RepID=UPI003BF1337C